MKKTISKIFVLLFVFALSLTFVVSCDKLDEILGSHTHEYVEGTCECGEKDPTYVPPHTHSFVAGECECGEKDPTYVPPHTHSFVNGECACGEKDPNYVPPHTHSYTSEQTKAPTCTEKGENTFTCTCGDSYTAPVDANGHNYVDGLCSVCQAKDPSIPVIVVLALSADKTQAVVGETVTLSAVLKTAEGDTVLTDVKFTIVEGSRFGSINGNVLTITDKATDGDVIKVKTSHDGVDSNIITVTVIPDTTVNSIKAEVGSYSDKIVKGSTVALIATIDPAGVAQNFVQWKITEGADLAHITGNSLTVNSDAPTGSVIKVVAFFGDKESNELTLTVTDPAIFSLGLSADKTQAVVGETVTLTTTVNGETIDVTYTIIEGEGIASIVGNVLTILEGAQDGDVIRVKTTHQGVDSNVITVTIVPSTHIDSIYASVNSSSQNIMKGTTVSLLSTVNPDGIAASFVQWKITEGADIASISGNSLTIFESAETGAVIKVVAYFGDVESNELEITVAATKEEINKGKYFLTVSNNEITTDKNGASYPMIRVNVLNYNFESVTDLALNYTVISGNENLVELVPNGNFCTVKAVGHGTVTIMVSIPNTNVSETITVTSIVPPTAVTLPEVFAERPMVYQFSYRDNLPFVVGIRGTNVCTDLIYTFAHEDGTVGDEVAVYNEDGTITFKKLGKVTVTATSVSGSRVEAKTSYTFNINNGYNVYNFAELRYLANATLKYNGQEINLVVLEKPQDSEGKDEYGYDLVPPVALLPDAEQNYDAIINGITVYNVVNRLTGEVIPEYNEVNARVIAYSRSLWINGNDHCINASYLQRYTLAEAEAYVAAHPNKKVSDVVGSVLTAEPWSEKGAGDPALQGKTYYVRLYDVTVKGNSGVSYDPKDYNGGDEKSHSAVGVTGTGINVGYHRYGVNYYVDMDGLTASGFSTGISFTDVVGNGTVSNLYAYDCYVNGIAVHASIMTLENIKFGKCGATGIEMVPAHCNEAGLNQNENQRVTITGTIDVEDNTNDGNSVYFQRYWVQGLAQVPTIIDGNIIQYPEIWVSHVKDSNGQFRFVSLIFEDFDRIMEGHTPENPSNTSIVDYPNYQEGGIINIMQLPVDGTVDTTHQFITLPIYATIPGLGNVFVGTALFYNVHYQAN